MKEEIKKQLALVLEELGIEGVNPVVEYPGDKKNGDYSSNVALIVAKKLGKNPRVLGEEIAQKLQGEPLDSQGIFDRIEVAGAGFINFWVSNEKLLDVLRNPHEILKQVQDDNKGRKVVVEYSSPNIAKPFTVGHLRSTIIGDAVANLLQATGWEVHRDNHLGDWGTQFGKQIYAIKQWGNEEEIENSDRPVKLLVYLYVKFHEEAEKQPELNDEARTWFKKLEDGDEEARRLWRRCSDWSWRECEGIYKQLGVTFTENNGRGYGESFFEDKMSPIVKELEEKGLLKEGEEGAKLVFFSGNKYPPLMILKKDGSTLYATRDLATDKFRKENYGEDIVVINEIGGEQSLYMQQIFEVEKLLGWYKEGQRVHVKHGLFRFKEGKMSTRKGNVVWLEDVLIEAEKRAGELGGLEGQEGLEIAKMVASGAIKWNDLKRDSKQDIVFDWDDILNMQGNSGPYMQYAFVRTQSILAKAEERSSLQPTTYNLQPEERDLLLLLSQFSEIMEEAANRFAPSILCTYLFELAQSFNLFYQKHQILKAEGDARNLRLTITDATGKVIKQGLGLLGITPPDRM